MNLEDIPLQKIKEFFFPAHFTQIETYGFPIMVFIAAYGYFLAVVNPQYFGEIFSMKYGFLCYLQTLFILMMLLLAIYRTHHAFFSFKNYLMGFVGLGMIATFIFGVGEKMRWGQFIFQLELPEFFAEYNSQSQITIHNLVFDDFSVNKVIFGTGLAIIIVIYTIIMPLLHQTKPKIREWIDRMGLPMATWNQVVWYLIGALIALTLPHSRRGEVLEFVGCFSILMILAFPRNHSIFKVAK